jgi:hypothetical protein
MSGDSEVKTAYLSDEGVSDSSDAPLCVIGDDIWEANSSDEEREMIKNAWATAKWKSRTGLLLFNIRERSGEEVDESSDSNGHNKHDYLPPPKTSPSPEIRTVRRERRRNREQSRLSMLFGRFANVPSFPNSQISC